VTLELTLVLQAEFRAGCVLLTMANPFAEIDTFAQSSNWQPRGGFSGGNYNGGGGYQQNSNDPPMKKKAIFYENSVIDMCPDQWDRAGDRVPFSMRGKTGPSTRPAELVCFSSNHKGAKDAAKMQRICLLLVKAADDFEITVKRANKLQKLLTCDGEEAEWERYYERLHEAVTRPGVLKVVSVEKYLWNKQVIDTPGEMKDFIAAMIQFMKKGHEPVHETDPSDVYVGHSVGKVDSPEGDIHVQEFRAMFNDPTKRSSMEDFMKTMQMPPPQPFAKGTASGSSAPTPIPMDVTDTHRGAKSTGHEAMGASGNPAEKKKGKTGVS